MEYSCLMVDTASERSYILLDFRCVINRAAGAGGVNLSLYWDPLTRRPALIRAADEYKQFRKLIQDKFLPSLAFGIWRVLASAMQTTH